MIEYIQLRNFQRWRKLRLEFSPRVTTLIGSTEAGKSTILRALKWAALNRFDGDANGFIHWDAKSADVRIGVDSRVVRRSKNRSTNNLYQLDDKVFRSFGSGKVPDEIRDLLALTDANFQNQMDAHFWLSQSAGEISRQLNQIVNLTSIDTALSNVATRSRRAKTEVEICERRLIQSIKERNELDWVPDANAGLSSLEKRETDLSRRRLVIASLRSIVRKCVDSRHTMRIAGIREARASGLASIASKTLRIEKQANRLSSLIRKIQEAERTASRKIPTLPDPKQVERITTRREKLEELIQKIERGERRLEVLAIKVNQANGRIKEQTKGLCPICGRPLKDTKA